MNITNLRDIDFKISNFILDEICFMLSRRKVITNWVTKFQESSEDTEIISIVFGALEFLIALAIAKLLNIDIYVRVQSNEFRETMLSSRFLLWNGFLREEGGFLIPYMSRRGLPDIEICEDSLCTLVEVTLGSSPQTLYYELNEVLRHTSSLKYTVNERVLLIPTCNKDFTEFTEFVRREYPGKVNVYSIYSIAEALYLNKSLSNIKLLEKVNCDYALRCCEVSLYRMSKLIEDLSKEINNISDITIAKTLKDMGYVALSAIVYAICRVGRHISNQIYLFSEQPY
jgi:hypothetical protein